MPLLVVILSLLPSVRSSFSADITPSVRYCAIGDTREIYNVETSYTHDEGGDCTCSQVFKH